MTPKLIQFRGHLYRLAATPEEHLRQLKQTELEQQELLGYYEHGDPARADLYRALEDTRLLKENYTDVLLTVTLEGMPGQDLKLEECTDAISALLNQHNLKAVIYDMQQAPDQPNKVDVTYKFAERIDRNQAAEVLRFWPSQIQFPETVALSVHKPEWKKPAKK